MSYVLYLLGAIKASYENNEKIGPHQAKKMQMGAIPKRRSTWDESSTSRSLGMFTPVPELP